MSNCKEGTFGLFDFDIIKTGMYHFIYISFL